MVSEKRPFKRLIVCCDGTWKDADGRPDVISNVTRIARCLKNEAQVGDQTVPQIVYYQSGVGTDRGWVNRLIGGVSGKGRQIRLSSTGPWMLILSRQVYRTIYGKLTVSSVTTIPQGMKSSWWDFPEGLLRLEASLH